LIYITEVYRTFVEGAMSEKKEPEIEGKESWRDLSITKVCETCGKEYHPRKNSYQYVSRFCSQLCARKRRKNRFV
jgi:hypothetical protein